MTRAALLRCIIRTAALAHWRFDRTRRACPSARNDNQFTPANFVTGD